MLEYDLSPEAHMAHVAQPANAPPDHVLAEAKAPDALGVRDRCEQIAGDVFKAVPPGGDAYLMKHIIHDWNDEQAGVILRNIRAALEGRPHGKVLLIEAVLKPGNEPDLSKLIDLEMMLLPGGRERTEEEFAALFARNGFQLTRVVPTQSPRAVVEGTLR
jgi:O-methyltransferase domain